MVLTRLGATFDLYQRAMASVHRVFGLLDTQTAIVGGEHAPKKVEGGVELKDVSFAYPDREPILQDFSLSIPAGQTVAIVGPTGSGKSTIVRLLLRFYDPQSGSITLDSTGLKEWELDTLRQSIGLVSQSVYLFDGSIWDNILYGRPDATEEDVVAAAKAAEVHEFIETLPQGAITRRLENVD